MEAKKVVVVANPALIPGGLQTVQKAVLKYLSEGTFALIECRVVRTQFFKPRTELAIGQTAHYFAQKALSTKKVTQAFVGVGFYQSRTGLLLQNDGWIEAATASEHLFSASGSSFAAGEILPMKEIERLLDNAFRGQLIP